MRDIEVRRYSTNIEPNALQAVQHPLLRRVYLNRGVASDAELNTDLDALLPFTELLGIEQAVALLYEALATDSHMLVVGDFDADGATSSALAVRVLRAFGAGNVDYLVPNRFEYGYGLSPEIVQVARARHPNLIITVDNGISSIEGVQAAHNAGIQVLVTDHHLPGAQLPNAEAIVNPNQEGCRFASKNLAGVGVIFYILLALRSYLRERGWFELRSIPEPNMAAYLDLVALGTVADVVPLDHNNRVLVEQGLRRIRAGRCVPGIRWLLALGGREISNVVASDLGFAAGPRLNAAGRLDDMSVGIECLLTDNEDAAQRLASQLDELNRERREVEGQMQAEALAELNDLGSRVATETKPLGLCLYDPRWHQGVIGILAARLRERYHRPVIIFAAGANGELKGSARSIPGVHIRDVMANVNAANPGLIAKFGGHAMAAGLSLSVDRLDDFSQAFQDVLEQSMSESHLQETYYSDGGLAAEDLDLPTAALLRSAGPWGQGFPEPVFDGVFDVLQHRIVGDKHLKMVLQVPNSQAQIDAIAFNIETMQWDEGHSQFHIIYRLDVNEYRGLRSVQLVIQHLRPATKMAQSVV